MENDANRLTRRKIPTALAIDRSKVPAWMLSLLLHTTILVALGLLWTSRPKGTSGERGGPVGIAVVVDNSGKESYYLSGADADSSSASDALAAQSSLPSASGSESAQNELLAGLLPTTESGGSSAATGDLGLGSGNSQLSTGGTPGKVKTKVFGIEGEGSRFVYVFDRSDSMNGYEQKPLVRAKEELVSSIASLGPTHQFQIVFYNDHPLPFGGIQRPKLLHGVEDEKSQATQFVKGIVGVGGTNHLEALTMALTMGPDVIFFLTDADDNPGASKVERIIDRADRIGATIHCIQFGDGNRSFGSNWINQLAERTRGQFRYVDVSKF